MVHRQMQGIHTRTTDRVRVGIRVGSRYRVSLAVPGVALADGGVGQIMRAMVDRQVQRVHNRATVGVRVSIRVNTCCGVGFSVPIIALTCGYRFSTVRAFDHRQNQRHRAVTSVYGGIGMGITARLVVSNPIPSIGKYCDNVELT